jgi:hypothetical protein
MDIGISIFLGLVTIIIVGALAATFFYLMDGFIGWSLGTISLACGAVILWSLFAWLFIIAVILTVAALVGFVSQGLNSD